MKNTPVNILKIKLVLLIVFVVISSTTVSFAQYKSENKKLEATIVQGMKDWKIPGLAAVVVKDGKVVFKKTYGVKNTQTKEPVDESTLFSMASTTKAIVAMALGILIDQGKIKWNDKVIDYLPSFKLSDTYITADARVKDLLTHNLGIANADLLWIVDSTSTKETTERFRYAKKSYPLRGGFTYQNIMYAIAGELIEAVSGQHWTVFVENNILKPLEMNRTQVRSKSILKVGNYVSPYYDDIDEGIVKVDYTFSDQIGAAGMMWSSANDISNYLTFLVNDGVFKGDTLLKPATFKYLFTPQVIIPKNEFYPTKKLTKPQWTTYGLGWFQHDYKGSKLDFHTGSLAGLVAIAGVMHEQNVAVYVFVNMDHAELRHAIMYKAIDLYAFNTDSRDWHQEIYELYDGFKRKKIEAIKKQEKERILGTEPSLSLKEYVGTYQHKMLGEVTVRLHNKQLELNFNNYLFYKIEHWYYNTFITNLDSKWRNKVLINFNLDKSGKVKELIAFSEKFIKTKIDKTAK